MSGFRSDIEPSIPLDRPTYEARIRHAAAYLTVESCGIFAIASAMCFTPSGPMLLSAILQATRVAIGQIQMCDSTHARESGPFFYLSEDTLLCLRPSHSAVMPSVVNVPLPYMSTPQSWLSSKLPGTNNERFQK